MHEELARCANLAQTTEVEQGKSDDLGASCVCHGVIDDISSYQHTHTDLTRSENAEGIGRWSRPFCPTWMHRNQSTLSCTLPGRIAMWSGTGISGGSVEVVTHCTTCLEWISESQAHGWDPLTHQDIQLGCVLCRHCCLPVGIDLGFKAGGCLPLQMVDRKRVGKAGPLPVREAGIQECSGSFWQPSRVLGTLW